MAWSRCLSGIRATSGRAGHVLPAAHRRLHLAVAVGTLRDVNAAAIVLGDVENAQQSVSTLRVKSGASLFVGAADVRFHTAAGPGVVTTIQLAGGLIDVTAAGDNPFPEVMGPASLDFASGGRLRVAGEHDTFASLSDAIVVLSEGSTDPALLVFSLIR